MTFVNEKEIDAALEAGRNATVSECDAVIEKAVALKGLEFEEAAALLQASDARVTEKIFSTAKRVKESIYGSRLVLFAPLYLTNYCVNNCLYCGFRRHNAALRRKALSLDEVTRETEALLAQGHKRLLLVAGEDPRTANIDFLEKAIEAVYAARSGGSRIRRLNVNVAPLSLDDFKRLKATGIGTYQLFQETYRREAYERVHSSGPKADYARRLRGVDDAVRAGIDDVGIGALFGLHDHRFEALALLTHARHLEREFGAGPHTISVPRLEPALNAPLANNPPAPVSDDEFKKLVAVLRLAVPYTGMILSTRETAALRDELFSLGISQISAGSMTTPGGYATSENAGSGFDSAQFAVHDSRSTQQVVKDVCRLGFLPSFCTACYRSGRTGDYFMQFAKSGRIQDFCSPNAILTFKEFLLDYADEELRALGETVITRETAKIRDEAVRERTRRKLAALERGERDLYF